MSQTTFLIGYGDERSSGRGIYQVHVEPNKISVSLVFACQEKPGGLIQLDNQLFLSFQGNDQAGIYRFDLNKPAPFQEPERFVLPFFITAWSRGLTPKTLLGSSFYDGVDVLLNVEEIPVITQSVSHAYRTRSEDKRQTSPHPHHLSFFPGKQFVCSVDMGIDSVSLLSVTEHSLSVLDEKLIDAPLGDGPRILRIRSDGHFAYLLNEISNSVCVFSVKMKDGDTRAEFQEIQRLSVIENTAVNNSPAACVLSSDERYLIVSNRGENTLVLYTVDFRTGFLTEQHRVATAAMPRDILIMDTSVIVAAQSANSVQLFSLDTDRHQLHLCSTVDGVQSPVAFMMTAREVAELNTNTKHGSDPETFG